MKTLRFLGMLILAVGLAMPALAKSAKPAKNAASKVSSKAEKGKSNEAVLGTLLEEIDTLNTGIASQAKEISGLKERLDAMEAKSNSDMISIKSSMLGPKELEPIKTDVVAIKKDTEELKAHERKWLVPNFELRIRPEYETNHADMDGNIDDNDFFVQQRLRLGLTLQPVKWMQAVVTIQDLRLWGHEASTKSNEKNLDLYQGYVRISDLLVDGLSLQAGRMELAFGAERQVSRNNFSTGRSFDGVRLTYDRPDILRADMFATMIKDVGAPAGHDVNFYGLYLTTSAWRYLDADLYGFYLENGAEGASEFIGTVGARAVLKPLTGLTIEGEAAIQFGKKDVTTQDDSVLRADHIATAYAAQILYEIPVVTSPTLGPVFYSASGDANPYDDRDVAYRPLFNTRHAILGYMDFFDWQGVYDIGGTFRMKPVAPVGVRLDYHRFYLSSDGGTLWAFDGEAVFPSGHGKYVGQELDLVVTWKAHEYLTIEGGYSFFQPGGVTKMTRVERDDGVMMMGGDIAQWAYLQGCVAF